MMNKLGWLGLGLTLFLWGCAAAPKAFNPVNEAPTLVEQIPLQDRWVISGAEAESLLGQGAILLDASGDWRSHPNSIAVTWQEFSNPNPPLRGQLLQDDSELSKKLDRLGLDTNVPVVVVGHPLKGWGEEGRIVWMLRSLGHEQAFWVDGGKAQLHRTQRPAASVSISQPFFEIKRDGRWTINTPELEQRRMQLVLIDGREPREFEGSTPYGEARGGHIPGAKLLYFKELLNAQGFLLPYDDLIAKLESQGITPKDEIVVYCTGGIRSAWLMSVLVSMGYNAKNYPGSMWEWSSLPPDQYPIAQP